MTISTLGQELKIICGVPRAPGDTASAEDALQVLDLLAGTKGFGVEPGGWIPQLPQVKNGGLWADSALADGRSLVSAVVGNITESITLTSNAATLQGRYYWEKELARFSRLCSDFWQTFGQIQPVYLKWWAPDAPGPQYALLYKIELAGRSDPFSGDSVQEIVISAEREPGWRFIAPGANPRLWTFEFRKEHYTLSDLSLNSDARNLAFASLQNRREWDTSTVGVLSQNYLDIPASDIPGDMPALVCAVLAPSQSETLNVGKVFLARSTKQTSLNTRVASPTTTPSYAIFNAADGSMGTDATIVADGNAPASNGSASGQRVTVSFATASMQIRVVFRGNKTFLDVNTFRGRYALYLRARASAAGTINARIDCSAGSGTPLISLPKVAIQQGVGGTPSWYLHYMGILTIPFWERSAEAINGLGLDVSGRSSDWNFYLNLNAERTSGAASLFIADLVLMPIDEAFCMADGVDGAAVSQPVVLDNTGYFTHGDNNSVYAMQHDGTTEKAETSLQYTGQDLTLLPGVNNRIYYLGASSGKGSPIGMNTKLRINIVPRCSGARSE